MLDIILQSLGSSQFIALFIGLSVGVFIGVLPGLGPLLGVVLAIPFTFNLDAITSMALLLGIYQGGSYGGAITAALIGIPGTPMAAITLLDARPMTLNGQASRAVTLATVSSSIGGIIGGVFLIFVSPALASIALNFGPSEIFSLGLLGLMCIATLSQGSMIKGVLAAVLGLFIASIGSDPVTGLVRFTFGFTELSGGVSLVALLVGVFAISEVLMNIESPIVAKTLTNKIGTSFSVFKTIIKKPILYIRSSLVGVIVGVVPGIGGVTSAFFSYKLAKDFSKEPESFGKGQEEGVIASEASNSATTGGALIPMLAVGIPGDPIVAVLMGGLLIQGFTPGPLMFVTDQNLITGIFVVYIIGAVLLLPIGLLMIPAFVRMLKVPISLLMSGVLLLSLIGTYVVQRQVFDLWTMWLFGMVGYFMRKKGFPLAPLVIGFVLGPIIESNFRRSLILLQGNSITFLSERPYTIGILVMILIVLMVPMLQFFSARFKKNG